MSKHFEMELDELRGKVSEMGGLAIRQLEAALEALKVTDRAMAWKIVEGDVRINALEREVDYLTVKLLATQQPVAKDLRDIVASLKMATDLERIADYAANVAKNILDLDRPAPADAMADLEAMGREALGMLREVLERYGRRSSEDLAGLRARDQRINQLYHDLLGRLREDMMVDPDAIKAGTILLYVARALERVGDHVTNIIEHVYYQVEGVPLLGKM